jgi:hypothetical protein
MAVWGWVVLLVVLGVEAFIATMLLDWRSELSARQHRLEWDARDCPVCLTGGDPMDFLSTDWHWCAKHKAQWQHIHDMEEKMRRQEDQR